MRMSIRPSIPFVGPSFLVLKLTDKRGAEVEMEMASPSSESILSSQAIHTSRRY